MVRFNCNDELSVWEYSSRMNAWRRAAIMNPLRSGTQFEMKLSAPSPRTDGSRRQITPSLREQLDHATTWYLVRPLQTGMDKNAQVWLASATAPTTNEVDSDDTNGDYIVLKIMQESWREYPDTSSNRIDLSLWRFQQDLVSSAVAAYNSMADFQGLTLPYFFGHVKTTAASGEELDLLALEFLHRPLLYLGMHLGDHPDFARWSDWNVFKQVAESAEHTLTTAHKRGVVHSDINLRNLFVDFDHNCLVIIDWEFGYFQSTEHHDRCVALDNYTIACELIKSYRGSSKKVVKEWVINKNPALAKDFSI